MATEGENSEQKKRIRYAVVGLGHIAQVAMLPAFHHAENSELVALVSDDEKKRNELKATVWCGKNLHLHGVSINASPAAWTLFTLQCRIICIRNMRCARRGQECMFFARSQWR